MLILSRREAEKILFPKLGITIEVTRVQGRTVRLGIDAPDEIRIIRAELEDTADLEIRKPHADPNNQFNNSWDAPHDIQQCLDAANLAIHLAQNQLRQQLNHKAEEALEHALKCLVNLESAAGRYTALAQTSTPVRESKTGYRCRTKKIAIVVDENKQLGNELKRRFDGIGYTTIQLDDGESLIEYLQSRDQPSLVLTLGQLMTEETVFAEDVRCVDSFFDDAHRSFARHLDPPADQSGLRMLGVGSLQKSKRTYWLGDFRITGWFAESTDADAMASCFA